MNKSETATTLASPNLLPVIGNVVIGVVGQLASLFVSLTICFNKPLRTPCFQLIAGGALGSFMLASYFFIMGFSQTLERGGYIGSQRDNLLCFFLLGVPGLIGLPFHAILGFFVGLDRIISLLAPVEYRTFGKRYALCIIAAVFLAVSVQAVAGFATGSFATGKTQGAGRCRHLPDTLRQQFMAFLSPKRPSSPLRTLPYTPSCWRVIT